MKISSIQYKNKALLNNGLASLVVVVFMGSLLLMGIYTTQFRILGFIRAQQRFESFVREEQSSLSCEALNSLYASFDPRLVLMDC